MWKRRRSNLVLWIVLGCGAALLFGALVVGAVQSLAGVLTAKRQEPNQEVLTSSRVEMATASATMTSASSATQESAEMSGYCVVIDPGHGGVDSPGVVCDGIKEAQVNLEIALRLKAALEAQGIEVILTRTEDTDVGLWERAEIANEADADVFISIHQNSLAGDTTTHGMETWYCEEKQDGSRRLAELVQEYTARATGAKNRGLRESNELVVIRETEMASCLLEVGFLSSDDEREQLLTEAYQENVAAGAAKAITTYLSIL